MTHTLVHTEVTLTQNSRKRSKIQNKKIRKKIRERTKSKRTCAVSNIFNTLKLFYLKFSQNHFYLKQQCWGKEGQGRGEELRNSQRELEGKRALKVNLKK